MNRTSLIKHNTGESRTRKDLVDAVIRAEVNLTELDIDIDDREYYISEAIDRLDTLLNSVYDKVIEETRHREVKYAIDDLYMSVNAISNVRSERDSLAIESRCAKSVVTATQKALDLYDAEHGIVTPTRPPIEGLDELLHRYQDVITVQETQENIHLQSHMMLLTAEHALERAHELLRIAKLLNTNIQEREDSLQIARADVETIRSIDETACSILGIVMTEVYSIRKSIDDYAANEEMGPMLSHLLVTYRNARADVTVARNDMKQSESAIRTTERAVFRSHTSRETYDGDTEHREYLKRSAEANLVFTNTVKECRFSMVNVAQKYVSLVRDAIIGRIDARMMAIVLEQKEIRDQELLALREQEKLLITENMERILQRQKIERHRQELWEQENPAQSD